MHQCRSLIVGLFLVCLSVLYFPTSAMADHGAGKRVARAIAAPVRLIRNRERKPLVNAARAAGRPFARLFGGC